MWTIPLIQSTIIVCKILKVGHATCPSSPLSCSPSLLSPEYKYMLQGYKKKSYDDASSRQFEKLCPKSSWDILAPVVLSVSVRFMSPHYTQARCKKKWPPGHKITVYRKYVQPLHFTRYFVCYFIDENMNNKKLQNSLFSKTFFSYYLGSSGSFCWHYLTALLYKQKCCFEKNPDYGKQLNFQIPI